MTKRTDTPRIETRPMDALEPFARNSRTHPAAQIAKIAGSLEAFGMVGGIILRNNVIAKGHATFEAIRLIYGQGKQLYPAPGKEQGAKPYPDKTAPVIDVSGWTEDQFRAYVIADNVLAEDAGWNEHVLSAELIELRDRSFDIGIIGIADAELAALTEMPTQRGRTDPDAVPPAPKEPVSRPGDLWVLGNHRLICGDVTDREVLAALLPGASAAICFTSAPYGVGLEYGTYIDTFENCVELLGKVAPVIFDVLRPGGFCLTNFGDIISGREINKSEAPSEYPMALVYWPAFTAAGFTLHTRRIWAKPHARVAAPWCASSNRAASDWEHIWTWLKPGPFLNDRRHPSYLGVWDTSKMEGVEIGKDHHPAAFPVSISEIAISVYSDPGDMLFEPFCGTGTNIIAAERTGRQCRAAEIDPTYTDMAIVRWQDFTGHNAILASSGDKRFTFNELAASPEERLAGRRKAA